MDSRNCQKAHNKTTKPQTPGNRCLLETHVIYVFIFGNILISQSTRRLMSFVNPVRKERLGSPYSEKMEF